MCIDDGKDSGEEEEEERERERERDYFTVPADTKDPC